ncbi:MAG: tRNA-dihydrouridine synthase family protein [Acidobacteriota bacterium]|jgi:nifR3 family TIM-barrel protein|nr:tRNA-dihydrouridine synthase family protein [Acidobacteriota bacterium]
MLKIGSLTLAQPTVLAPMAGLTDHVLRQLADEIGGCGLLVSEMIAAEGLRRRNRRTMEMIASSSLRTPQFIQLFGANPEALSEAAAIVSAETAYAGIDINMGCPVPKVVRSGAGSGLLRDLPRLAAVVAATRRSTALPLTVKVRLGFSQVNVLETTRIIEQEGADAVAVHFRLKSDGYTGSARWDLAAAIRENLRIPLLGNGDIMTPVFALEKLKTVDGLLIGRGALANPFIFREIAGQATSESDWGGYVRRLAALIAEHYPERKRLGKLKAFTRFLVLSRPGSRAWKRRIFLSQDFVEARGFLEETFPLVEEP